jgi:hypothetical protein
MANYESARIIARKNADIAVVEYEEGVFKLRQQETDGDIKIAEADLALAEAQLNSTVGTSGKLTRQRAELSVLRARLALEKAHSRKKLLVDFTRGKRSKELRSTGEKTRSEELAKKAIWNLEMSKQEQLERRIANCSIIAPRDGRFQPRVAEVDVARERQVLFEIVPAPVAKPENQ